VIGARVRRREDRPLLTGRACFLDDLAPPGTLDLAFARSTHGHARLHGVDLDAAARIPGVALAFGAQEMACPPLTPDLARPGAERIERPILAADRVRFVGEAFAAAVATSRYVAEDAAERIAADYEPLAAVTSVQDALRDDLPRLHGDGPGRNVIFEETYEYGDVAAGFDAAATVIERTFHNPRYCATPLEGRGVLAIPADGGLVLWSSTQIPHILEEALTALLGIEGVSVRCPDIGGGFGQKAHVFPEEVAVAWAALHLDRPVKWVEDRVENFVSATHAREQLVTVRVAADAGGRLLALESEVYSDVGAYGIYPWGQVLEALGTPMIMPGPYVLPAYRYHTHAVATNKPPQGAYRGVGLPVAALAHERLMDTLAGELGLDRGDIRRVNYIPPERFPFETATGLRYDSGNYRTALDLALERIGYDGFESEQRRAAEQGRTIGLGFASYVEWTGTNSETYRMRGMRTVRGYDAGRVSLNEDGTFSVWTSCPAIGQGVATTFAQIVAEHLGVGFELVHTQLLDTSQAPRGSGTFASRSAISAGGALISISQQLRQRLVALAADMLEARPEDIVIDGSRAFVRGSPSRGVGLAELHARGEPGQLDIAEPYDPEHTAYPYATHACVVEIDGVTGDLTILRYVVVEDCGPEINPIVVEGQVHGATAQGIGGTMFEALRYGPDGQPLTASFMDYLVPGSCEMPTLLVEHLETPARGLRAGHKGVGEGGTLAPGPALANAVTNALGVEVDVLPIMPEWLATAARARARGHASARENPPIRSASSR
jgi:carbon-monoxide dehydrogenase large subunit